MTEQHRRELGWCEEAQTYCSCNEEAYKKGTEDTIEKCAEIMSHVNNICGASCPAHCHWGTELTCKEAWKEYLIKQMKGAEE